MEWHKGERGKGKVIVGVSVGSVFTEGMDGWVKGKEKHTGIVEKIRLRNGEGKKEARENSSTAHHGSRKKTTFTRRERNRKKKIRKKKRQRNQPSQI